MRYAYTDTERRTVIGWSSNERRSASNRGRERSEEEAIAAANRWMRRFVANERREWEAVQHKEETLTTIPGPTE